jgi:hypothetical protein
LVQKKLGFNLQFPLWVHYIRSVHRKNERCYAWSSLIIDYESNPNPQSIWQTALSCITVKPLEIKLLSMLSKGLTRSGK